MSHVYDDAAIGGKVQQGMWLENNPLYIAPMTRVNIQNRHRFYGFLIHVGELYKRCRYECLWNKMSKY